MREIALSQGKKMLIADQDYDLVSRYRWSWFKHRNTYYAQTDMGNKRRILAHRLILGPTSKQFVDHVDFNGLNNIRSNLRLCSWPQNCQHASCRRDNSSGYRGVHKLAKGFVARIRVNGKRLYLGYFPSALAAAKAYDNAAKQYHGEYASLNFVEGK